MLVKGTYGCVLIALAACCASGCNDAPSNPSRWEKAQQESTGTTTAQRPEKSDSDVSETPPAWNAGGTPAPSTAEQETDWKVGGKSRSSSTEPAKPRPPQINMEDLKTGDVLPGGKFNKFFPQQEGEWDLVYKQEKQGFALASLRRGGEELAQLSITDLRSNPEAAEKYLQPAGEIQGYPTAAIGSKGLGVLVGARFQIQVRSATDTFTPRDREEWVGRFDLKGLEGLK